MLPCMVVSEAASRVFVSQRRKSGLFTNPEMKSASSPIKNCERHPRSEESKFAVGGGVWLIKSRSCNCSLNYLGLVGVEVEAFV